MSEPKTPQPRIIEENEWLIAIDKPPGLIAHSDGRTEEPSLAEWVGEHFPELRGVGGAWVSPQGQPVPLNGLVHRLDRSTSGVMIAAKNDLVFDFVRDEFKRRLVEKKYLAWVYGRTTAEYGVTVAEIVRSTERPRRWYARACPISDPRAAVTEWRVRARHDEATFVEIAPKTGRTHQIRVHFSHIGHPLVADHLYARERPPIMGFKRPALHAQSIRLTLPDGTEKEFNASEPIDFHQAMRGIIAS